MLQTPLEKRKISSMSLISPKLIGSMAAATFTLVGITGTAHAQQVVIAQTVPGLVTFTGGNTGLLSVSGTTTFTPRNGLAVGSPVPAVVTLTTSAPGAFSNVGAGFEQAFGAGAFSITSPGGGTTLLSGTFGGSFLNGTIGGTSGGLNLTGNTVTYSAASTLFPAGFLRTGGSLSLAFSTATPFVLGGGGVAAFTGIDLINYSAVPNPIPEPSEWMAIGMAGTSLFGLMLRARRRRGQSQSILAA
jgi:hypothetical protein